MDYIDVPIETDPDELAEESYTYLQTQIPGWAPAEGNLETKILDTGARLGSRVRDQASRVPRSIFREYGGLVGVEPVAAAKATAKTTWTAINNAGYTVRAGTLVGIRTAGDDLIPFEVLQDVVIPPGQLATAAGAVTIIAVEAGLASSSLGAIAGPVELIDPLDWVLTVVQTTVSSGGVDAEGETPYLNRLATKLQTLADRPILAVDFAIIARDVAGVFRAVAVDNYIPAVNEKQTVRVNASATGGTFTLSFNGQVTGAIAYNATAATISAALIALNNIGPADVVCTGGPVNVADVTVEFTGALAGANQPQMVADGALLTGAGAAVVIATTQAGAAAIANAERAVTVFPIDTAGESVSAPIKAEVDAKLEALREVNFLVYVESPTYTTVDVTYTVRALTGYTQADVLARVSAAISSYLNPGNWGIPEPGTNFAPGEEDWVNKTVVRFREIDQVINSVAGVDYIENVTIGVNGGAQAANVDVNLTGVVPLPRPGAIVGTVNLP